MGDPMAGTTSVRDSGHVWSRTSYGCRSCRRTPDGRSAPTNPRAVGATAIRPPGSAARRRSDPGAVARCARRDDRRDRMVAEATLTPGSRKPLCQGRSAGEPIAGRCLTTRDAGARERRALGGTITSAAGESSRSRISSPNTIGCSIPFSTYAPRSEGRVGREREIVGGPDCSSSIARAWHLASTQVALCDGHASPHRPRQGRGIRHALDRALRPQRRPS